MAVVFEAESHLWCVFTVFCMIGNLQVDRSQGVLYRRPTLHMRALGIGWHLSEPLFLLAVPVLQIKGRMLRVG
jgi:hypothetical protein